MKKLFKHLHDQNQDFYISTNYTFDQGLETMIFAKIDGEIDWSGINTKHHNTEQEAIDYHKKIVKEYIKIN